MIKLTKLEGKPDSSLPVGFWVEGAMERAPEVGKLFCLFDIRYSTTDYHDGRDEWFHTTQVISIEGDIITTQNSKWRIETT